MGFLGGLLQFALEHFDVLAWPLFALVYPLCSSIRAIEANSISDTQKLNTYWVVHSLVLLFEHTCMKLLEWLPLWPYIRLMVVVWLVIPHFDGALYVYEHLICPCLSMDPQILANWFNKEDFFFMRENFLAEVESYVKENGPEALENIVACKSETTKSNLDMKCLRAVSSTENKESKPRNNNVEQKDIKAVQVGQAEPNLTETHNFRFGTMEIKQKPIEVAADRETLETPPSMKVQEATTQIDATLNSHLDGKKHKAACEALEIKNQAEPKLNQIENSTFVAVETKEKAVEVATGIKVLESSKNVQKEWTCALCQITTSCETNLNMHLEGTKHKAAYEAMKAKNHPNEVPRMKNSPWRCNVCNLRCPGEIDMASHLEGRKHAEKVQEVIRKNDPLGLNPLWCKICKVSCTSEFDMASHLCGRKHLDNPLWCKICNISCSSESDMASHLGGRKHLDNPLWCQICKVTCSSKSQMASHLDGRKHKHNLSAGM